jgi:hypothetical protein
MMIAAAAAAAAAVAACAADQAGFDNFFRSVYIAKKRWWKE